VPERSSATASASVGFPVFTIAFFVLLILKVAGQQGASWGLANLSWWWVFSPLLFGFGLFLLVMIFAIIVIVLAD
jgi:hypothetical protein